MGTYTTTNNLLSYSHFLLSLLEHSLLSNCLIIYIYYVWFNIMSYVDCIRIIFCMLLFIWFIHFHLFSHPNLRTFLHECGYVFLILICIFFCLIYLLYFFRYRVLYLVLLFLVTIFFPIMCFPYMFSVSLTFLIINHRSLPLRILEVDLSFLTFMWLLKFILSVSLSQVSVTRNISILFM